MSQLLPLLLLLPFFAALTVFVYPIKGERNIKGIAIALSLLPLLLLLVGHGYWLNSQILMPWIPALGIELHMRIDALSLLFLYLTALIVPIALAVHPSHQQPSSQIFFGLILLVQGFLMLFFTARDLALFVVCWEAMLVPLYFIISLWGGSRRQHAALKFLIYMIAGSAFLIAATLALYFQSSPNSFNLDTLAAHAQEIPLWVAAVFFLAFAVKTPLFPFHAWLPEAYCEAPLAGTILLAALLSKAGIYGFLRLGLELFPQWLHSYGPWLLPLAIAGTLYGALAAWQQHSFKRLIAYASLSHVNFILAGIFVWNEVAHQGALLQAVNHAIVIAALFLVASWFQERINFAEAPSGLMKYFPTLGWLTLFIVMAAIAIPGSNSFVGELMILFGLFKVYPWHAAVLGLSIILSAIYMLGWLQRNYFGPAVDIPDLKGDISLKELTICLPLLALILAIGIYPAPILEYVQPAIQTTKVNMTTSEMLP